MKKIFLPLILFIFALNTFAQRNVRTAPQPPPTPRNVILLIGDGMGTAQVFTLISTVEDNSIVRFPVIGYQKTASADNFVTESAAAGTALATGRKTNNNMVSVCPETGEPMTTLVQSANARGLSTGVIASCCITHATPAAFLSHSIHRRNYEEIAEGIVNTNPTLFIGGGRNRFEQRRDNRNLSDSLRVRGFQVLYTLEDIKRTQNPKIAGLLWDIHPPSMADGRGEFLKPATQKSIELLNQNPRGFFLMVESAQIDWLGHDNDFEALVEELKDFDNTIHAVLEFAKRDGNTLVIVTGDHETGGLSVH
ncbi:MAG: alkaline phosphatase, partial [Bacteroidales bacterium]|nr:alkaline phosphatase [Bacteroidales bacterium]